MQINPAKEAGTWVSKGIIGVCPIISIQRKEVRHNRYTHFIYNGTTGG